MPEISVVSWHSFSKGKDYALDKVVAECHKHIESGKVEDKKQKKRYVQQINDSGYSIIRYSPKTEGGWGSSPMNPDNWRTPNGSPIREMESVPKSGNF